MLGSYQISFIHLIEVLNKVVVGRRNCCRDRKFGELSFVCYSSELSYGELQDLAGKF